MGVRTPPFLKGDKKTMSDKIVQLNEEIIKSEIKELVRSSSHQIEIFQSGGYV